MKECDFKMKDECSKEFTELKKITDPSSGALSVIHEKINRVAANRPTWKVFIWVVGLTMALASGAYVYTSNAIDKAMVEYKTIASEMKADTKEMRRELLEAIRELRK